MVITLITLEPNTTIQTSMHPVSDLGLSTSVKGQARGAEMKGSEFDF